MTTKINELFSRARKAGLVARQNYLCCSSCAGYGLTEDIQKMVDKGKPRPKGTLYYHRQDADALKEPKRGYGRLDRGTMMLRYGPVDSTKYGSIGLPVEECGQIICQILKEVGIKFEWSGKGSECIAIEVEDALDSFFDAAAPLLPGKPVEPKPFEMLPDEEGFVPGTRIPLPKLKLVGEDGSAYAIMGRVREALRKKKVPREVELRFVAEATSGDYNNVIATAMRYAEVM